MKPILFLSIFCSVVAGSTCVTAQNFTNPDLDGTVFGTSSLPDGWEAVPAGDPVSVATNPNVGDTPDLTDDFGPNGELGISGIPFSGDTFVSGARSAGFVTFQEGIQQTVGGFEIGESYSIEFYQSVVKQIALLDQSGSWAVYRDNDLIEITEVSFSTLAYNNDNLVWEERSVSFTAEAASHTFKFLPVDDDANGESSFDDITGGLRMGIDLININQEEPCVLDLGEDLLLCSDEFPIVLSSDVSGDYLWSTGEETPEIIITEPGIYSLSVEAECGSISDEIIIEEIELVSDFDLGENLFLCPQDFPVILTAESIGTYVWNTSETTQSIVVTEAGDYSVSVSNSCGSVSDIISISLSAEDPDLDLGQNLALCQEEFPFLLDAGSHDSYQWSTGETNSTFVVNAPGTYEVTVSNVCGETSDNIIIEEVEAPSTVNLGGDISVCENLFPINLSIPETDANILWSTGDVDNEINVDSGGAYSVTISNQCGSASSSISVNSIPNINLQQTITLCAGETEEFLGQTFSESGVYSITAPAESPETCDTFWEVNVTVLPQNIVQEFLTLNDSGFVSYGEQEFTEPGVYEVIEISENGCNRSVILTVDRLPEIFVFVPNAFTPDGSGINDVFKPVITLDGDISLTNFNFKIFDRWGGIVFESTEYANSGWNGSARNKSGYYAQDGVYNWVLSYSTSNAADAALINGSVLIVR